MKVAVAITLVLIAFLSTRAPMKIMTEMAKRRDWRIFIAFPIATAIFLWLLWCALWVFEMGH